MKPIIFPLVFLLLAGCNPTNMLENTFAGIDTLDRLGVNYDTNGYRSKGSTQKICPYVKGNITTWRPC